MALEVLDHLSDVAAAKLLEILDIVRFVLAERNNDISLGGKFAVDLGRPLGGTDQGDPLITAEIHQVDSGRGGLPDIEDSPQIAFLEDNPEVFHLIADLQEILDLGHPLRSPDDRPGTMIVIIDQKRVELIEILGPVEPGIEIFPMGI